LIDDTVLSVFEGSAGDTVSETVGKAFREPIYAAFAGFSTYSTL
jgi:hypothetical protein